MLGNQLWQ